jgi:hypothetical protein
MTRTRTTPYHAQLDRLLNDLNGDHRCFSALTLSEEFEHPRKQKPTTTLDAIHKALRRAWSEGKLIAFTDGDGGGLLREDAFGAPGSAAVEHPLIFGTPGTASPRAGYSAATYAQHSAERHDAIADDGLDLDDVKDEVGADRGDGAAAQIDGADGSAEPLTREMVAAVIGAEAAHKVPASLLDSLTADGLDAVVLRQRMMSWKPTELPPEWVPEVALRRWVSLSRVIPHWRAGLDQGSMQERARLLRLGVRRKGSIAPDSLTARGLAQFVRDDLFHWTAVADLALSHYMRAGEIVPLEELPALAEDPVDYYLDSDLPGPIVLLSGLALRLDEGALRQIAADIADGSEAREPSAEEQLRFELSARDAEMSDLQAQLRTAQTEVNSARKDQEALAEQLDRLRDADRRAGSSDEELVAERARARQALSRVAELEAQVEALSDEAARAENLEVEVRALESLHDELFADAPNVERERRLREQAEAEVQTQLRRVRELTQALHDATEQRLQLPVDDGPALITALAAPVAAAAQHALGRMAARTTLPGDAQLLRFAATFAALSEDMPVSTTGGPAGFPGHEVAEAALEPDAAGAPPDDPSAAPAPSESSADGDGVVDLAEDVDQGAMTEPSDEENVPDEETGTEEVEEAPLVARRRPRRRAMQVRSAAPRSSCKPETALRASSSMPANASGASLERSLSTSSITASRARTVWTRS